MQRFRQVVQVVVLAAAVVAGVRFALWGMGGGVERYCPFGGLETAWSFVTQSRFSCATGELNLALFLALVAVTLLARKAFCGWLCPVGTISEWVRALAGRLRRRVPLPRIPAKADRALRWLRLPVLGVVLWLTWKTGELIFRAICPYYVAFSVHGHDVKPWSYAVMAVILAGVVVVPMAWCRYLCPLGGALWPLARVGALRLRRDMATCTACGACDRACPQGLAVSAGPMVASGDCTMCLECVAACPAKGTLGIGWPGEAARAGTAVAGAADPQAAASEDAALQGASGRHDGAAVGAAARARRRGLHWAVVPVLLVTAAAVGVAGARFLSVPSLEREYAPDPGGTRTIRLTVKGLRCVDTARQVSTLFEDLPGVVRMTAFAAQNRADVTFDPAAANVDDLVEAVSGPVLDPATGEFWYGRYEVVEVDGEPVVR